MNIKIEFIDNTKETHLVDDIIVRGGSIILRQKEKITRVVKLESIYSVKQEDQFLYTNKEEFLRRRELQKTS